MNDDRVIELYREHDSCRKVAEIIGANSEAVRQVLIRHNIKRTGNRKGNRRKTDKRMPSNCRTMYCSALVIMLRSCLGLTTFEIRNETGIPSNSIDSIIRRKCPELKCQTRQRINSQTVDAIERDYITGASSAVLSEKYGYNAATISKLMRKRGHIRGKGGGAVMQANELRHNNAVARMVGEYGNVENAGKLDNRKRREFLIAVRKRDLGITWKSLARRNGSMKCEICGIECNPNDKEYGSYGPTHPSVDHIVRICDGGEDVWENVRLACMACNLRLNVEANRKCKVG